MVTCVFLGVMSVYYKLLMHTCEKHLVGWMRQTVLFALENISVLFDMRTGRGFLCVYFVTVHITQSWRTYSLCTAV